MSISYQAEVKDGVMVVTASGRDESLQQVIDYGLDVRMDTDLVRAEAWLRGQR